MNWVVVGLIAGVVAYLVDWLMWGKVFTKGMDAFVTPMTPEEMKRFMGPAMAKSAVLALIFGVLFAWFYGQFRPCLWVQGGGPLAGMEFATVRHGGVVADDSAFDVGGKRLVYEGPPASHGDRVGVAGPHERRRNRGGIADEVTVVTAHPGAMP